MLTPPIAYNTIISFEPAHDKTNKMTSALSRDSDQPGHPPSLISLHLKKDWAISYPSSAHRRVWSEWVDAQAYLTVRWAHRSLRWFCHAPVHFYHQIAGALAEEGRSLEEVTKWAKLATESMGKLPIFSSFYMNSRTTKPTKWHVRPA